MMVPAFRRSVALLWTLLMCGCAALLPLPPMDTQPILLLQEPLPPGIRYEVVGRLVVPKAWYGSTDWVLARLAADARALQANAVIDIQIWYSPYWSGWETAHGTGTAVRVLAPVTALTVLKGQWR